MDYFLSKMENYKHKFTPEEVVALIVIGLMIATAIWMLLGSPTEMGAIIAIFGFTATSEILLWKKIFSMENKTSIGFMKVKQDLELMENRINTKFDKLENSLNKIEKKIK